MGLTGWESDTIEVIVAKSSGIEPLAGFVFRESRRSYADWVHPTKQPAVLRLEEASLLAAERQVQIRASIGLVAACVQQRLTTAQRLFTASLGITRLRHGRDIRLGLLDIQGGAQPFAELEVARRCAEAGLQAPQRQTARRDASGRLRYLDLMWLLADGRVVVLEVDGSFHLRAEHWWRDMRRERKIVVDGSIVLRCSTIDIRLGFEDLARDLAAVGVPRSTSIAA